jgi:hypothetical protein
VLAENTFVVFDLVTVRDLIILGVVLLVVNYFFFTGSHAVTKSISDDKGFKIGVGRVLVWLILIIPAFIGMIFGLYYLIWGIAGWADPDLLPQVSVPAPP